MVETKRKKGETFESFLRRFNKKLLQSGKIIQAKKIKYSTRPMSSNKKKELALRRIKIRQKKEYLKKTGQIKDDTNVKIRI